MCATALPYVGQDFYGNIDTANLNQYENLDRLIEWCIENDIHVCLDCHSTPGGLNYYNSWDKENNVRWMLQEYGCSTYIPQEQQIECYKMITETCKPMQVTA